VRLRATSDQDLKYYDFLAFVCGDGAEIEFHA
jgi:hypothetical protein